MWWVTCSHCHATNGVTGGPVTCETCGHRADLARLACDCWACRRPWYLALASGRVRPAAPAAPTGGVPCPSR